MSVRKADSAYTLLVYMSIIPIHNSKEKVVRCLLTGEIISGCYVLLQLNLLLMSTGQTKKKIKYEYVHVTLYIFIFLLIYGIAS